MGKNVRTVVYSSSSAQANKNRKRSMKKRTTHIIVGSRKLAVLNYSSRPEPWCFGFQMEFVFFLSIIRSYMCCVYNETKTRIHQEVMGE